jgi:hypothetical protein
MANAAKFTALLSTLNNQLIFNVYFCHIRENNWLLQTMRRVARCWAKGTIRAADSHQPRAAFYPAAIAGNSTMPFEPKILREH